MLVFATQREYKFVVILIKTWVNVSKDGTCLWLCSTMLERLDRRSITLLDVVTLCDREATSLCNEDAGNHHAAIQPSTSHVLHIVFAFLQLTSRKQFKDSYYCTLSLGMCAP